METFIELLNDYIVEKNISIREFAKQSGISLTRLSEYFKGAEPTLCNACKIAQFFNCSLDYLFGLSSIKNGKPYKDIDMSKFLEKYDALLEKNNISHWKLSKKSDISESSRRRWRNGDVPKVSALITIAKELGSSIDYLTGRV